jgi:hypothetical protein
MSSYRSSLTLVLCLETFCIRVVLSPVVGGDFSPKGDEACTTQGTAADQQTPGLRGTPTTQNMIFPLQ